MFLLGHIGITVFISSFLYIQPSFAFIAILLPDFVDKLLLLIGVATYNRFIAHTIFFGPIASLIVYAATKRKDLSLATLSVCYLHLLEDAKDFLPLFYPLVKYSFPEAGFGLEFDWFTIATEGLGILLLAATVLWYPKILKIREKIFSKVIYSKKNKIIKR